MPRTFYLTDLSVGEPLEISQFAIEELVFSFNPVSAEGVDSGLSAVSVSTLRLVDLGSLTEVDDDTFTATTPDENQTVITINAPALGLVRGAKYELLVVFSLDNGTTDEGTLVLEVVA